MDTRGYYVYRFRGRYYIYYNHMDSHPAGLGKWIVGAIPTEGEAYKAWLDSLRTRYAEIEKILEQNTLIIKNPDDFPIDVEDDLWLRIDERLDRLPSFIPFPETDVFISWIYLIDLDREIFIVKAANGEIHYKLDKIPRSGGWHNGLIEHNDEFFCVRDRISGPNVWYRNVVPLEDPVPTGVEFYDILESWGNDVPVALTDSENPSIAEVESSFDSLGKHLSIKWESLADLAWVRKLGDPFFVEIYNGLTVKMVTPKFSIDVHTNYVHSHLLRHILFDAFVFTYDQELVRILATCQSQDFAFKEFVFAIISIASGTFVLLEQNHLHGEPANGFLWVGEKPEDKNMLPTFGKGCHNHYAEAGSAPSEDLFWYNNAVICLDDSIEFRDRFEAAIAKVVCFGRDSGREVFDGLIISLFDVVLLRHYSTNVVEHTVRVPLFDAHRLHKTGAQISEGLNKNNTSLEPEMGCQFPGGAPQTYGFNALIHFFDAAIQQQLRPSKAEGQRLPLEVLHLVLDHVDDSTYLSCSQVSSDFRDYTQRYPRIGSNVVLKARLFPANVSESSFVILDNIAQQEIQSAPKRAEGRDFRPNGSEHGLWLPIIGPNSGRPSIIEMAGLKFPGVSFQTMPATEHDDRKRKQKEKADTWMLQLFDFAKSEHDFNSFNPFPSTAHATWAVWEQFLRDGPFAMHKEGNMDMVQRDRSDHLLPANTQSLLVTRYPPPNLENYAVYPVLLLWIKRLTDDSLEKRQAAVEEAAEHAKQSMPGQRSLVGVVFGYKIQLFVWRSILSITEMVWDAGVGHEQRGERSTLPLYPFALHPLDGGIFDMTNGDNKVDVTEIFANVAHVIGELEFRPR